MSKIGVSEGEGDAVIADVAPPGSSIPSSSSRPVVPHRDIVRDPMTITPSADSGGERSIATELSEGQSKVRHTSLRLEPVGGTLAGSGAPDSELPAKSDDDLDQIADEAEKVQSQNATAVAAKEAGTREAEIDALIASKQYALPISSRRAHKTGRTITLLVFGMTVLSGVGYYYYVFVL